MHSGESQNHSYFNCMLKISNKCSVTYVTFMFVILKSFFKVEKKILVP